MSRSRAALALLSALTLVLLLAAPAAWAATADAEQDDAFVVLAGPAVVGADETFHTVVVGLGDATIEGTVDDVFVASGDVVVTGEVTNQVTALDGTVTVESGGRVAGDVAASQAPVVATGGEVGGTIREVDAVAISNEFARVVGIYWWIATTVSLLAIAALATLLVPRAVRTSVEVGTREAGPSVLVGLVAAVVLPVLVIVAAVTLVGVPLALGIATLIGPIATVGYLVAGAVLGRLILRRDDALVGATLLGVAILQIVAAIPFLAPLLLLAAMYGTGAAALAAWRYGHPTAPTPRPAATVPTVPAT